MKTQTNRFFALLFFAVFTALYGLTRTSAYSYDGLCYALDAEFGPPTNLFHANHLLYGFSMRGLWHVAMACGYHGPAIYVMQAANLLAAAGAVSLLFLVLSSRIGRAPAALAALWMGASHALWINASDPGCYGLATFAATFLLALFLKVNEWPPFILGFLHGVAILFHQLLLLPAVAFLLQFRARPFQERHFPRIFYMAGLASSCGIVYLALGWHFHGSGISAVAYWLTHPADALGSPPGTHFWSFSVGRQLLDSLRSVAGGLVANPNRFWIASVWMGLLCCSIASFRAGIFPRGLWAWLAILFGFQLFYYSGASTYRLLSWPPLFALLVAAPVWKRRRAWAAAFLVGGVLLIHNAAGAFSTHAAPPDQQRTAWVRSLVSPRDFFIFAGQGPASITNVYFAYFAHDVPARSLYGYLYLQHDGNIEPLNQQLRAVQAGGGRVFIEETLRDPQVLAALEAERGIAPGTLAVALKPWKTAATLQGLGDYRISLIKLLNG